MICFYCFFICTLLKINIYLQYTMKQRCKTYSSENKYIWIKILWPFMNN